MHSFQQPEMHPVPQFRAAAPASLLNPKAGAAKFFNVKPRLFVCFSALFSLGCSLIVYQVPSFYLALPFLIFLALGIFNLSRPLLWGAAAAVALGMFNAQIRLSSPEPGDISRFSGESLVVSGTVASVEPLKSGKGMHMLVVRNGIEGAAPNAVHGNLSVNVFFQRKFKEGAEENFVAQRLPASGDRICFRACLQGLDRTRFKNASQKYVLAQRHIFCQAKVPFPRIYVLEGGHTGDSETGLDKNVSFWRALLVDQHRQNLGKEDGNLLASMVLGDKAVDPGKEITDSFRASGLSHVLAASGFNLSVVATAIYFVTRYLCNLWLANGVCFLGMAVFVLVAGPSPSVVRAFLMGAVLLLSRCLSRSAHLPAVLSLSAFIVMLIDPATVSDVGFQLSYFSTAGMIIGASEISRLFSRLKLMSCLEWAKAILAGTLLAQCCVLPLQLFYFRQFNPYCLLANLIVTPFIPALSILGFASSFCFALEHSCNCPRILSSLVDKVCYWPLELIRFVVLKIASFPYAQAETGQPHVEAVLLYFAVLLSFPFMQLKGKTKIWTLIFGIALALLIAESIPCRSTGGSPASTPIVSSLDR